MNFPSSWNVSHDDSFCWIKNITRFSHRAQKANVSHVVASTQQDYSFKYNQRRREYKILTGFPRDFTSLGTESVKSFSNLFMHKCLYGELCCSEVWVAKFRKVRHCSNSLLRIRMYVTRMQMMFGRCVPSRTREGCFLTFD